MTEHTVHPLPFTSRRTSAVPWPLAATAITLCFILGARVVETFSLPLPRCTFRALTGLPCLSCGTTRCFTALSHLDLLRAFHFNPLATCVALALLVSPVVLLTAARWHGCHPPTPTLSSRATKCLTAIVLAAVLANWMYLILKQI